MHHFQMLELRAYLSALVTQAIIDGVIDARQALYEWVQGCNGGLL